jgi:hypothetical protein
VKEAKDKPKKEKARDKAKDAKDKPKKEEKKQKDAK